MKRTIKCAALLLALVLLCAGCGKKQPAQPDQYGLALELSRQTLPEKPAELTAAVTTYAPFSETPSMHDDVLEVAASQNGITVTNRSDAAMSQVYVYYKNASGDLLLGGITYRAGLTDLGPLSTGTGWTFSGTSRRSASTSPSTGPAMPPMSGCAAVPCLPGSRRISGPCGSWAWG